MKPSPQVDPCKDKKGYRTQAYADKCAVLLGASRNVKLKSYWCDLCKNYHLEYRRPSR